MKVNLIFGWLLVMVLLGSCVENLPEENLISIEEYFASNDTTGWHVQTTSTGMYYRINSDVEGDLPVESDVVVSSVILADLNDIVLFDSQVSGNWHASLDESTFLTQGMIEAFKLIPAGGRITAFIPHELGYGDRGLENAGISSFEDFRMVVEHLRIKTTIPEYIEENELNAQEGENGLYYVILEEGNETLPQNGNEVIVHYTGTLLNDNEFDSSVGGQPFSFRVGSGEVIEGWDVGIKYFPEGSTGILLIPHQMGYGGFGTTTIPPYEHLKFEIEIVQVVQ